MSLTGEIAIPAARRTGYETVPAGAYVGVLIYGGVEVIQPDRSSCGGEASDAAAERIEQQAAIAALHHRHPQPYETRGTVAEVMGLPAALGQAGGAEEGRGDLAVARLREPPIEGAQCQHQSVAPCRRQCRRIAAERAAGERAPKPQRGRGAKLEQPVERQQDTGAASWILDDMKAEQAPSPLDQPFRSVLGKWWPEREGMNPEVRVREIVGKLRDGDDARQRCRRPEDPARVVVSGARREIARPSAARNRRGRRR